MDTTPHITNVISKKKVNTLKTVHGRRRQGLSAELLVKRKALQVYQTANLQVLTVEPQLCTASLLYRAIEVSGILK